MRKWGGGGGGGGGGGALREMTQRHKFGHGADSAGYG